MCDRGPSLKEIDAFDLLVTTGAEPSLELLNGPIRISFDSEIPCARKDLHMRKARHELPTLECIDQRVQFLTGRLVEFSLEWSPHSVIIGQNVSGIFSGLQDAWVNDIANKRC